MLSLKTLIFALFVSGVVCSFFPDVSSPVFFWSGTSYFTSKNAQYLGSTDSHDITDFILSTRTNSLSKFHSENAQSPELVVMYIERLSAQHSFKGLKSILDSATSSLLVPYNYHKSGVSAQFVDELIVRNQKVIVAQDDTVSSTASIIHVQRSGLKQYLQQHTELFNNGATDYVLVYLPDQEDSYVSELDAAIKTLSNSNYVAIYATDSPSSEIMESITAVQVHVTAVQRDMWYYAQGEFWPVSVWEGILASIVLIVLLLIGVGCTATVQTPNRWGTDTKLVCQFTEINDP